MPISQGLQAVNAVISSPNWDINRLLLAAADRAAQEIHPGPGLPPGIGFGISACRTTYGMTPQQQNLEIFAWYLCILLGEYTAGLLAQKAEEGHCNAHRTQPDYKPCPDMAKEHIRMLAAFKAALKNLHDEIERLEQQTKLPAAPAPAAP